MLQGGGGEGREMVLLVLVGRGLMEMCVLQVVERITSAAATACTGENEHRIGRYQYAC